jgi:hypothetical protein
MGIMPEEKGFAARHRAFTTIALILIIIAVGIGLRYIQQKYFPAQEQVYKEPVFINESFEEVDKNFNVRSSLTPEEKDTLFKQKYQYNAFKWTCKPLGCVKLMGKTTLKLICRSDGFTEDLRLGMNEDCTEAEKQPGVTVSFQLLSKTEGEYYIGRAGTIVSDSNI